MSGTFERPAPAERREKLMAELVPLVVDLHDDRNRPLPEGRVIRHMIDRWTSPSVFLLLDEFCGIGSFGGSLFPDIPAVKMFGNGFGNGDVLHVEIDWLGTDAVQFVISYNREARERMVAERLRELEEARERRAREYPPLEAVLGAVGALSLPAWRPVFGPSVPGDGKASRYFGKPWMPAGAAWPVNDIGEPLAFVMQLNIGELPGPMRKRLGGSGMLSMFYDTSADFDPHYDTTGGYETNAVFEVFDVGLEGGCRGGPLCLEEPKAITGWRAGRDHPSSEDLLEEGLLPAAIGSFMAERGFGTGSTGRKLGEQPGHGEINRFVAEAEDIWGADSCDAETAGLAVDTYCAAGDKLGGWPSWDYGRMWPEFRGKRMAHFLQLDLMDDHWKGFAFWRGDERGHVFFSEDDPKVFRLCWDRGNSR